MTANKAASETRLRIVRKIRSMCHKDYSNFLDFADDLIAWIQIMDTRANKRSGGLGRK